MQKRNYAKELEMLLASLKTESKPPRLLLHACCAPCSSHVLEYLSDYFEIDLLYYNPNISPKEEYAKRLEELKRLIGAMPFKHRVQLVPCAYDGEAFSGVAKGLEFVPEGGERCEKCFRLRLTEAAKEAKRGGYDYFTTTLSISPLKNAELLNRIVEEVGQEIGVPHLPADFKKKDGYKRSLELSKEYDLYRQDYCGCLYSKAEREAEKRKGEAPCRLPIVV